MGQFMGMELRTSAALCFTRESFKMEKVLDLESTDTREVLFTKVNGKTI